MLNYYHIEYSTYHNDTYITSTYGTTIIDEKEAVDTVEEVTWENLKEFFYHKGLKCGFNIYGRTSGKRIVSFYDVGFHLRGDKADVWEKSGKPLNITIKTHFVKGKLPISEILKWHDADTAIRYLNERGLNICGNSKIF